MVKAKSLREHSPAHVPTESHAEKRPAEKSADVAVSGRDQKTNQPANVSPALSITPKASVPTLSQLPLATEGKVPADHATGSGDVVGTTEGSSDKALSGRMGTRDVQTTHEIDGTPNQQGAAPVQGSPDGAGSHKPTTMYQSATLRTASGDSIPSQDSGAQIGSPDGTVGNVAPNQGVGSGDGIAAPTPAALPDSNDDALMMLSVALPPQSVPGVETGASAAGPNQGPDTVGMNANPGGGLTPAKGATKNGAPGGGSPEAKLKYENVNQPSSILLATAPLHKNTDTIQSPAQAAANSATDANPLATGANGHGNLTEATPLRPDATSGQHGSENTGSATAETAQTPGSDQAWDPAGTQVVHRAQLIQAMHQSEMRMGMNSAEFGNISISAAVSHQTLTAQISLDHPELSRALTAQLPEIEKGLGNAYGLLSRVEVRDSSSSAQQGSSRDGDRSQGNANRVSGVSQTSLGSAGVVGEPISNMTYSSAAGMRLDILI